MKIHTSISVLLILGLLQLSTVGSSAGIKQNKVKPIAPVDIEKMIRKRDCPLFIVAMAAWCAPCRAELPVLQKLHEKYAEKGLKIIGVSVDIGGPSAIQPLVDQMRVTFPVYWGGEKVVREYKISGIPLLLIAKKGEIVEKILGGRPESVLEEKILSLIDQCERQR